MEATKVYISVVAAFLEDGTIEPKSLTWTNGREYAIKKVLGMRPAAAEKCGGQGDRYTVQMANGDIRYLFFEHNPKRYQAPLGRWFVEKITQ